MTKLKNKCVKNKNMRVDNNSFLNFDTYGTSEK